MDPKSKTCSIVLTTSALLLVSVCIIFIIDIMLSPPIESDDNECKLMNGITGKCVISSLCEHATVEQNNECGKLSDKVCCSKIKLLLAKNEHLISLKSFDGEIHPEKPLHVERVGKGVGEFKNDLKCGRGNSDRIVGGSATAPAQFAFFAALIYRKWSFETERSFTIGCGGSLINGSKIA